MKSHFLKQQLYPSQESAPADGQARPERELVYYAQIVDYDELEKADSVEHQEQWEARIDDPASAYCGTMRMRVIDGTRYVLTVKTSPKNTCERTEVENELPAEAGRAMLEQLKKLRSKGMIKTRYTFKVPGSTLCWEFDVFSDPEGKPCEWCKIDLEVPDFDAEVPPFPIQLRHAHTIPKEKSAADIALLAQLYDHDWVTPSPYAK